MDDKPAATNGVAGSLHAELTDAASGKLSFSVRLTETSLTIRRSDGESPAPEELELSLADCVGSRAFPGRDEVDRDATLSVYFYPYRQRRRWGWISAGGEARQRVEHSFRLAHGRDARANLAEAERWARAVRRGASRHRGQGDSDGVQYSQVSGVGKMMVLVNPLSGRGQAMALYAGPVKHMFTEAAVPHTLITTEHQNHARELVRNADLSQWSSIVILSGDGLLFEVINGLMERDDWQEAIQTPLGILPGGSGNALAASVHHYTKAGPVWGEELLLSCGFLLCKGQVRPLDLVSLHLSSGPRLFSFLSLAWGFVADVDIESEKFRHVGAVRFMVGTLLRLASLRTYQGRLSFLPSTSIQPQQRPPGPRSLPPQEHPKTCGRPVDDLLSPLSQPVPPDWTVVQEQDFVLVLAMCHSHLAEDLMAAPDALPDDRCIHLFYVTAGISRPTLLRLFLAMEKGTHLTYGCPQLFYRRVRALRLEPFTESGVITVDGEQVEYGPVQAQVHPGLARLISA